MKDIDLEIDDIGTLTALENGRAKFYDKLNRGNVIQNMIKFIDDVKGVDFVNDRAKRYISESRPRFVLSMSKEFMEEFDRDVKKITNHIHTEVIRRYLNWVSDFINDDIDVSKLLDSLRSTYGEDRIKSHIIETLSNILVDIEKKELTITLMI